MKKAGLIGYGRFGKVLADLLLGKYKVRVYDKESDINYEGVDYLEDENSGEIYSTGGILIGKWNEECDNIIWENDKYKENHLKLQKSD